jgi:hypothetical protein
VPFPARERAIAGLAPWVGAAVGAQLVTVPCALIVSDAVGTGTAAYVTAAATGAVCATGSWLGATRTSYAVAPDAPPIFGRPGLVIAVVAVVQAALAMAAALRLAGGVDPLAPTLATGGTYGAAALTALLSARRRIT